MAVVMKTEGDRAFAGAAEQGEIDFQAGKEHQQKLAQICQEVRDGTVRAEQAEDIGADDDAAEQQPHGRGDMRAAAQPRDEDEHDQRKPEPSERRKGQDVMSDEVDDVRDHGPLRLVHAAKRGIRPRTRAIRPAAMVMLSSQICYADCRSVESDPMTLRAVHPASAAGFTLQRPTRRNGSRPYASCCRTGSCSRPTAAHPSRSMPTRPFACASNQSAFDFGPWGPW
jgi:hypothetical protein